MCFCVCSNGTLIVKLMCGHRTQTIKQQHHAIIAEWDGNDVRYINSPYDKKMAASTWFTYHMSIFVFGCVSTDVRITWPKKKLILEWKFCRIIYWKNKTNLVKREMISTVFYFRIFDFLFFLSFSMYFNVFFSIFAIHSADAKCARLIEAIAWENDRKLSSLMFE